MGFNEVQIQFNADRVYVKINPKNTQIWMVTCVFRRNAFYTLLISTALSIRFFKKVDLQLVYNGRLQDFSRES